MRSLFTGPLPPDDADRMAAVMKAVAEPARLQLLAHIRKARGKAIATQLWPLTGLSQSTVSKHLHTLLAAGLIRGEQESTCVRLSIEPDAFAELAGALKPGWDAGCEESEHPAAAHPGPVRR